MLVYRILWLIRTVLLAILIVNVAIVTDEYEVEVVAVLDRQWMNCYHKKNFFFQWNSGRRRDLIGKLAALFVWR